MPVQLAKAVSVDIHSAIKQPGEVIMELHGHPSLSAPAGVQANRRRHPSGRLRQNHQPRGVARAAGVSAAEIARDAGRIWGCDAACLVT